MMFLVTTEQKEVLPLDLGNRGELSNKVGCKYFSCDVTFTKRLLSVDGII